MFQHVRRHHVAEGVQLAEVSSQVPRRLIEVSDKGGLGARIWVQARQSDDGLDVLACRRGQKGKQGVELLSLGRLERGDMAIKKTKPRHRLPLPEVGQLPIRELEL